MGQDPAEQKHFYVHKIVLVQKSTYFKTLFESGMKEENEKEITFNQFDSSYMEIVLEWIYGVRDSIVTKSHKENCCILEIVNYLDIPNAYNQLITNLIRYTKEVDQALQIMDMIYSFQIPDLDRLMDHFSNVIINNMSSISQDQWQTILAKDTFFIKYITPKLSQMQQPRKIIKNIS